MEIRSTFTIVAKKSLHLVPVFCENAHRLQSEVV